MSHVLNNVLIYVLNTVLNSVLNMFMNNALNNVLNNVLNRVLSYVLNRVLSHVFGDGKQCFSFRPPLRLHDVPGYERVPPYPMVVPLRAQTNVQVALNPHLHWPPPVDKQLYQLIIVYFI